MSDKFFVDTNVLVYAHDRGAEEKHEKARPEDLSDQQSYGSVRVVDPLNG